MLVFQEPGTTEEPDLKFVHAFDTITSFHEAAQFIEDWIRRKKHSPHDFRRDLPELMDNALLIRAVL